jgi:hypothetical protein
VLDSFTIYQNKRAPLTTGRNVFDKEIIYLVGRRESNPVQKNLSPLHSTGYLLVD